MDPLVVALLVVPFAGAVVCGVLPRSSAKGLASLVAAGTAALAIAATWTVYPSGWETHFGRLPWLPGALGGTTLFGLLLDPLSSLMVLVITVVGFMVVLYSSEYLTERNVEHAYKEGDNRYYFWLLAFMGSMVGVALSPNLLQMFLFWEMTTLCSWALISHTHTDVAQRAGVKALVMTHIGGFGFLLAICLLFAFVGDVSFGALGRLGGGMRGAVFLLLLVAAYAKSAQVPFHTWLPDAMEAPTPISAYLHAAAMVKAGVYLVARLLSSVWEVPAYLGLVVAILAMITIFMAIVSYFRQDDLKRLLAYSTIAHLGYILMGCALGIFGSTLGFRGGVLHILCHGVAKGTLFLCVGAIAYGAGTRHISQLSGLARRMPLAAATFMIGALAVTGVPPFSTFWSKLLIFTGALEVPNGAIILVLLVAESVVSFSWFLWIAQRVFLGAPSQAAAAAADPPPEMSVALIIGMVLCLAAPIFGLPLVNLIAP
jgi:hydrogenase-4 component D